KTSLKTDNIKSASIIIDNLKSYDELPLYIKLLISAVQCDFENKPENSGINQRHLSYANWLSSLCEAENIPHSTEGHRGQP
ncbi:MAG: hypothetical protein AAF357_03395, partial [Verrucomicrobiota bacterium]